MMKDVASHLPNLSIPSVDDLIRLVGLQRRSHEMMPSLALFGTGILVGAGLALLFAPSSGRELRAELGQKASDLTERMVGEDDERYGHAVR